ncbi:MAG: type II secretion system F family protein [Phycisphaerae bacterium]|nr:type II secretion system F family protein [Phycisphaerae bacterium]
MLSFSYSARDESGQSINGTIAAESMQEATRRLRAEGKYPIEVHRADEKRTIAGGRGGGIRISRAELIQLSTQLAIMSETGVTLLDALNCIRTQAGRPQMQSLMNELATQVEGGADLSAALARHPRTFPRLYIALMKASERSGMLGKMLNRATQYLRDEQDTRRRVKGALTYPAIMLSFAVLTTTFLLAFVMPKFTVIYASKGAALPVPTRVLMAMSDALVTNWMAITGSVVGTAIAGYFYFRAATGRRQWHWLQLRLPLIGPMFRKMHLARGMRMIGTMAGAGVGLIDCVTTATDLSENVYFEELWKDVSLKIQTGKQLSEPLSASPLVPRSVAQMISSGERGGKLGFVMEQIATFSEQELKETIAELTRYIEPAMIVVMGFIIGGVALALMLPIFTISRVVAH